MITQNIKFNQTVKPNSKEIEALRGIFPHFFDKDDNFLFDRFKKMLAQNDVTLTREGYELKFLGKSYARYLSATKTETFIAPDEKHNSLPGNKNSENVYIIGDNIDALKHLIASYTGKIKCIYIDPPYNTGSDGFVYPDNFSFTAKELVDVIGIEEDEAERILNLAGKSSHSAWLTFIYPRLVLARTLLSENGVIFISIDDNEAVNLELVCNEIFGEENLVTSSIVIVKTEGRRYGAFAKTHETFLVYAKNKALVELNEIEIKGKTFDYEDEYGGFNIQDLRNQNARAFNSLNRPNLRYPIYVDINHPDKNAFCKVSLIEVEGYEPVWPIVTNGYESVWRWGKGSKEKASMNIHNICARKGSDGIIRIFEKVRTVTEKPKTVFIDKKFLSNKGTKEVAELLGEGIFDFPKPLGFIEELLKIGTNKDSIVLDFFSGAGTTAHAVMNLNVEDDGHRKYILVQLPEKIQEEKVAFKVGYKSIDEIGRHRIKMAAEKIKEKTSADIDYGYKVYKLEAVNDNTLTKLNEFEQVIFPEDMVAVFDNESSSGKEAILMTYLVMDGYGFNSKCEQYLLKNYTATKVEDSLYIIDNGLSSEDIMFLIRELETMRLNINRIVLYSYSIRFDVLQELRTNIQNLQNNKNIELIERY
ncbi:site-specific DNA-methyltransferase [Veillonella sp.]|uniref:site-specific DNA-methyltransferase n=1 Tax=Veillonella sp. TaxID=1926307 RepID=UPI0025FC7BB8|nr:site-specific DNA-methyltransferase [Veillonella sp.]